MGEAIATELITTAIGIFFDIVDILISILPAAPFRIMLSKISESSGMDVLGYVNYFIPFQFCAICFDVWLDCIIAFYVYKYLKKAIEDYRSLHRF